MTTDIIVLKLEVEQHGQDTEREREGGRERECVGVDDGWMARCRPVLIYAGITWVY
jgi:hypothetical protein